MTSGGFSFSSLGTPGSEFLRGAELFLRRMEHIDCGDTIAKKKHIGP
jgi:hypothetical protein